MKNIEPNASQILSDALKEGGQLVLDAQNCSLTYTTQKGKYRNESTRNEIEGNAGGHRISLIAIDMAYGRSRIPQFPEVEDGRTVYEGTLDGKTLSGEEAKKLWEKWYEVLLYKNRMGKEK